MKKLMILSFLFIAGQVLGQSGMGEIQGYVYRGNSKEPMVGARIYVEDNGRKYQAKTDLEGAFRMSAIPAGPCLVNIYFDQDTMYNIPVTVPMDGIARMGDIAFSTTLIILPGIDASAKKLKMIDGNLPVKEITAEDIVHSPNKFSPKEMIIGTSSDIKMSDDGELMFRGARKGDMLYLIDGVKTSSIGAIPSCSIGRMNIYTGGVPAKYGDTMGGVVVMETKSYFDLYRAWEAKQIREGKM